MFLWIPGGLLCLLLDDCRLVSSVRISLMHMLTHVMVHSGYTKSPNSDWILSILMFWFSTALLYDIIGMRAT